jgi:hypothetical protein
MKTVSVYFYKITSIVVAISSQRLSSKQISASSAYCLVARRMSQRLRFVEVRFRYRSSICGPHKWRVFHIPNMIIESRVPILMIRRCLTPCWICCSQISLKYDAIQCGRNTPVSKEFCWISTRLTGITLQKILLISLLLFTVQTNDLAGHEKPYNQKFQEIYQR